MRIVSFASAVALLVTGCGQSTSSAVVDEQADIESEVRAAPTISGLIGILNLDFGHIEYGSFAESTGGCLQQRIGACVVNNCTNKPPSGMPVTAGTLSIWARTGDEGDDDTTPNSATPLVSLEPIPGFGYLAFNFGTAPLPRHIKVTASGDSTGVAAFTQSTSIPDLGVVLIAPAFSAGVLEDTESFVVDRGQPLDLTWVPNSTTACKVNVLARSGTVNAECTFDPEEGHGRISAKVWQKLPAGAGEIQISMDRVKSFTVNDASILMHTTTNMRYPDGTGVGSTHPALFQ